MRPLPLEVDKLASRRFGVITRAEILDLQTPSMLSRHLRSGLLLPMLPGVYRVVGAPRSWRQRAIAACLYAGPDTAVSHLAAGYLWQVPCIAQPRIDVSVPPRRRVCGGGSNHYHRRVLPSEDTTERWGIRTTTPARTLIDLSGTVPGTLLIRVHDDLARCRHLGVDDLDRRLDAPSALPRCDRRALSEIRHRQRTTGGPGGSPREDWVVDTLIAAGLPSPHRGLLIELGGTIRELDCAYPDERIAIEYDSWTVHADRIHFDGDREKSALLQLAGWLVLQVTSTWSTEVLVSRVAAALNQRRRAAATF